MKKINISDIPVTGMPLYEMRKVYNIEGSYTSMTFSLITLLPGQRVPAEGLSCHDADEYSMFLEGEVYTESGSDFSDACRQGEATFIPRGETHWCENRTDAPCVLACVMIK